MNRPRSGFKRGAAPSVPVARLEPATPAMRLVADDRFGWLTAAIIGLLIVYLTVPDGLDYSVKDEIDTGSAATKVLWIGLFAVSVLLILWRGSLAVLLAGRTNLFIFAFIALAAFSVLWSIEASFTLKRTFRLLTFLAAAASFCLVGWHERRFQNVVRPILTLLMAGSLIFGMLSPELAIEQSEQAELMGAWHGLAMQKNSLGALAGIGTILWLHAGLAREVSALRALLGGLLCGACLVLSRSSTSLMATAFAMLLLVMVLRASGSLRPYLAYLVTMFTALLLLYSLAVLHLVSGLDFVLTPITAMTGKDLTFSGRTAIWDIINEHISMRPLLGSGYGAYWIGPIPGTPSYEFVDRLAFYPSQSHNGYLEIVNDLGLAGGLCLLGFLIVYVRQSLALMKSDQLQAALYLSLFFQQLIGNLSEARWFLSTSVDFAIMIIASVALARALLNQRLLELARSPTVHRP